MGMKSDKLIVNIQHKNNPHYMLLNLLLKIF